MMGERSVEQEASHDAVDEFHLPATAQKSRETAKLIAMPRQPLPA